MSKTFCPLPWIHLATHPNGDVTLCCESDMDNRNSSSHNYRSKREFKTLYNSSFNDIFNSDLFKEVRLKMLNSEIPEQCKKCFIYEKNNVKSKRQYELERLQFSIDDARKIIKEDGSLLDINLEFIELRLGNHCNLACRSCNPYSSTKWKNDWNKLGKSFDISQDLFDWSLSNNFWKVLIKYSTKKLKYIYINGGEPLLVDKHSNYLKALIDLGLSKNIVLYYSTNGTIWDNKYIDIWKQFKKVNIQISIDDINKRFEYIRYGAKWDNVYNNFKKFASLQDNIDIGIIQTIGLYNVFYMREFHNFFKKYNIKVSHNFINNPNNQSIAYLPNSIKKTLLKKYKDEDFYYEIKGVLESNTDNNILEFLEFTEKLDNIRNENFTKIFTEWSKIIKDNYEFDTMDKR